MHWSLALARYKNDTGTLDVGSTQYNYELGDRIMLYDSFAHGLQVKLGERVPNIVLDSHHNDSRRRGLPFVPNESQRLELEGDFYKNFAVYAPEGLKLQALQLLTPEVMALIADHGQKFDIELYGRNVSFLTYDSVRKNPELRAELVQFAAQVMAEFSRYLKSWARDKVDHEQPQFLKAYSGEAMKTGRHVVNQPWVLYGLSFVVFVGICTYLYFTNSHALTPGSVLFAFVVLVLLGNKISRL